MLLLGRPIAEHHNHVFFLKKKLVMVPFLFLLAEDDGDFLKDEPLVTVVTFCRFVEGEAGLKNDFIFGGVLRLVLVPVPLRTVAVLGRGFGELLLSVLLLVLLLANMD